MEIKTRWVVKNESMLGCVGQAGIWRVSKVRQRSLEGMWQAIGSMACFWVGKGHGGTATFGVGWSGNRRQSCLEYQELSLGRLAWKYYSAIRWGDGNLGYQLGKTEWRGKEEVNMPKQNPARWYRGDAGKDAMHCWWAAKWSFGAQSPCLQ